MNEIFPKIQKGIENLIEDEEGNIPGSKLLFLGTIMMVLGSLLSVDGFAAHRSHSSHQSHSSHRSSSSGSYGGGTRSHASGYTTHSSHESHTSHDSHQSHISHTSHSNTASHSNSRYSAEGDVTYAPPAASIPSVASPPAVSNQDMFHLPDVNENIQNPNATPTSSIIPALSTPDSSPGIQLDTEELTAPASTEKTE